MIALGSERWTSSSPKITLTFEYEKQRSGADMQYRAKITISTVTGSSYFGYPIYLKLTIGSGQGETVTLKNASPSQWSSAITYTSSWYTVAEKTSGTTPISFKVYSGSGSSRSGTYSYEMGVDPAASEISAPNGTLGVPLKLTLTRYNSAFTDSISYQCGTAGDSIVFNPAATSVTWDDSNGNTVALSAQNTKGQSVDVTFIVTTRSGSTVVGMNSIKVTMAIPESVKPSVALAVEDAAGYLATYGAYVQGYSKLKITATPTLAYGSPITNYEITADGSTYTTSPVTTPAIQGKGTQRITAKVTDARTHFNTATPKDITVLEYAKPAVTLSAYRCDSEGAENAEGAYMKIVLSSTISSLNSKNSARYTITYPNDAGTKVTVTGTGLSYTSPTPIACDVSKTRTISVVVSDNLSSTPQSVTIPIAYTLMDYHSSGRGIAFGKVGTREGFDCAMTSYFGNNRLREVGSPTADTDAVNLAYLKGAVKLTSADNLNNIKVNGFYWWDSDSVPTNVPPGDSAFYMQALRVWTSSGAVCCQELIDMTDSAWRGSMMRRIIYGNTAYEWEWINPPMVSGVEYRTTERCMGKPVYTKIVSFGGLPNATSKYIEWYPDSGTVAYVISAVAVSSGGSVLNVVDSANPNTIWIVTKGDYSAQTAYVVLKYIKS